MNLKSIYYKIRPMAKLHIIERNKLTRFHKIYLVIIAICGLPFASLGMLLAIPAILDLNPAVFLLLLPFILVVWDCLLLIRGERIRHLKKNLIIFYTTTGLTSVWGSTWTYNREGTTGFVVDPIIVIPFALFFTIPIIVLLNSKKIKITEPENTKDAAPSP